MHKLDEDTLVTPALIRRFGAESEAEGGDGRYSAVIQRSNGELLTHSIGPDADALEMMFATDLLTALNRHLHHDGAWCMVFTHYQVKQFPSQDGSYHRFVIMWMDKDGDVQFPIEWEEPFEEALALSIGDWMKHCETGWGLWHLAMRQVLDPKANQLFRRAAGEAPPTVH